MEDFFRILLLRCLLSRVAVGVPQTFGSQIPPSASSPILLGESHRVGSDPAGPEGAQAISRLKQIIGFGSDDTTPACHLVNNI